MADQSVTNSSEPTAPDPSPCRKPYTYISYSCRSIPWTEERVARLKELWARCELSAAQIAKQLGITRNSVLGKVDRLDLPSHQSRPGAPYSRPETMRPPKLVKPMPEPEPDPPMEAAPFLAITFAQLTADTCRYPRGDGPIFYCGQPSDGQSYCPACYRLTHVPSRPMTGIRNYDGEWHAMWSKPFGKPELL
jgi:GcrA cell cycle regulator